MAGRNEPADVFKLYDMNVGEDECWLWQGAWGGRDIRPYFQAASHRKIAYRWVFELVNGVELTAEQLVIHSCDHGNYPVGCGNPSHMRLGTNQDNKDDAVKRQRVGLPHNVVRAIRTLLEQGRTQQEIADLYGVSREAVREIGARRIHKTVE